MSLNLNIVLKNIKNVGVTLVAYLIDEDFSTKISLNIIKELIAIGINIYASSDTIPYFISITDTTQLKSLNSYKLIFIDSPMVDARFFKQKHLWEELKCNSMRANLLFKCDNNQLNSTELFIQYIFAGMPLVSDDLKSFINLLFKRTLTLESKLARNYIKRLNKSDSKTYVSPLNMDVPEFKSRQSMFTKMFESQQILESNSDDDNNLMDHEDTIKDIRIHLNDLQLIKDLVPNLIFDDDLIKNQFYKNLTELYNISYKLNDLLDCLDL
jgi:hypothetical protein